MNGSLSFFAKNCTLYPILDIQVYNALITKQNLAPHEISDDKYATLSVSSSYSEIEYKRDFEKITPKIFAMICKKYEKAIVSTDNIKFYYIENCKKRKFLAFKDVEAFRNTHANNAIRSISEYDLSLFESGWAMRTKPIQIDLGQTNLEILANLPSPQVACAQVKEKAQSGYVAYYTSSFYFEDCVLKPILNLTIEIMQKAEKNGGIYELSTEEFLALPQGSQWNKKN